MAFTSGQVLTAAQLNAFDTESLAVTNASTATATFTANTAIGVLKYDVNGYFEMSIAGTDRFRFGNDGNDVTETTSGRGFSAYTDGAFEYYRTTSGKQGSASFTAVGDTWTSTAHNLVADDAIIFFVSQTDPPEFNNATVYYVGGTITANSFQLYDDTVANSGVLVTGSVDSSSNWLWDTHPQEGSFLLKSDVNGSGISQHILYASGHTANRLNVYGGISDARVKENIEPYGDPRQDLVDMEVISYNFMGSIVNGEVVPYETPDLLKQVGYSAQDVLAVKPGLVAGNNLEGYSFKTTVLVPILHRAWQLDHADLQALEERVAALEA